MRKVILFSIFLAAGMTSHGQSAFGIQIDFGSNSLVRISDDKDDSSGSGYSKAEYDAKNTFFISPSLRYRIGMNNKFSFEVGLGYAAVKNKIQLKDLGPTFHTFIDTQLNIHLQYVHIPAALSYTIPINDASSLVSTAMVNTNILVNQEDNFQDIIYEEINLGDRDWYNDVVIAAGFSVAYQVKWNGGGISEWGLFVNRDINAFVKDDYLWGFYENLLPARNLRYGLQLKYFLP